MELYVHRCTGPTGVAATNYDGGMTTHSLLGLSKGTKFPIERITEKMKKGIQKIGDAMWLVMDEISMTEPKRFVATDKITKMVLQNERLFGGLSIILGGDFKQKGTPAGMALSEALFKYGMGDPLGDVERRAAMLFSRFRKFDLTRNHRQKSGEIKLNRMLSILRDEDQPMEQILPMLKDSILTRETLKDPSWQFAPTVVCGNRERIHINEVTAHRFARSKGCYLLKWDVKLTRGYDEIVGVRPCQYFVPDAPAILSQNISMPLVRLHVV